MNFLNTILYYICFASVVLIYGIGTNNVIDLRMQKLNDITYAVKLFISILVSSMLSWFVTKGLLVPLKLTELFPLTSFLIFICINAFLEALVRLTTKRSSTEFVFSYLVIVISVFESTSFINTVAISVSCICSFLFIIPFILAFRRNNGKQNTESYYCKLFLYIAILILVISVFDVMWLNPGVIK
ncbi:MAG: hypothetical protein K5907_09815 [Treponema sp.]|nr:hypothetical protein [Treponema sp.]